MADVKNLLGAELARKVSEASLKLYVRATEYARERGIIIADTKFEFGLDEDGQLRVMDEVLTPGLVAFLARGHVPARLLTAELRQAIRARLSRDARLGEDGARAASAGRGHRAHAREILRSAAPPHGRDAQMSGARSRMRPRSADRSTDLPAAALMELVTNYLERLLWPPDRPQHHEPASRWLTIARYAYALLRDLMLGDLSLRAMSLVYTTMLAIVPLLAFSFSLLQGPRVPSRARAAAQQLPRAARAALGRAHAAHHRVRRQRERLGAARRQHLAVDPVRAVDGAEGRDQLQLRVEGRSAAQLRAPRQRVLERDARSSRC